MPCVVVTSPVCRVGWDLVIKMHSLTSRASTYTAAALCLTVRLSWCHSACLCVSLSISSVSLYHSAPRSSGFGYFSVSLPQYPSVSSDPVSVFLSLSLPVSPHTPHHHYPQAHGRTLPGCRAWAGVAAECWKGAHLGAVGVAVPRPKGCRSSPWQPLSLHRLVVLARAAGCCVLKIFCKHLLP